MTSNEQHLLMCEASAQECIELHKLIAQVQRIFECTEPPRRDSSGPETAHLNLRVFKCVMQAKEAAAMLEAILQRTRHTQGNRGE